jgi:hypothetical protein
MSKKIQITVVINVEDDDYEVDFRSVVTGPDKLEACKDLIFDCIEYGTSFDIEKVEVVDG